MSQSSIQLENPGPKADTKLPFYLACLVVLIWSAQGVGIPALFLQPPQPVAVGEANSFSAERAASLLETLVGDGIPHPAGSDQNDIVRDRIVTMLQRYGYETEIHKTSNSKWRVPGEKEIPLENILARLPGRSRGKAVLLASHYDSTSQGPGASDDGVGTAALLEIAKMLREEGPFERDIIFLISDGEELGLLGADKFVEEHPWAKEIECVVNLEARGTTGPSFMFETSEHSRWLIPVFAKSVPRPMTSSLFYEVYKLLPNDTDFTMFKRGGMQGFNFAFVGNVNAYHTAEDTFENIDMGTLQHHGENMLGLVRTLADTDFDDQPTGRVVYFDLLGMKVIWWPAAWSFGLGLFGMTLVMGTSHWCGYSDNQRLTLISIGLNLLYALLAMGCLSGLGFALGRAMWLDGTFDHPWPEFPWPVPFAFYLIAMAVLAGLAWCVKNFVSAWGAWSGVWSLWAALTLMVAWKVDGISYLFIIPLIAAGISGSLTIRASTPHWSAASAAIACGFLWLPLEALFYDALGFKSLGINLLAFRSAIVCSTFWPVLLSCNRSQLAKLTAILGGGSIIALLASLFTV